MRHLLTCCSVIICLALSQLVSAATVEMLAGDFPQNDADYRYDAKKKWRFILPPDVGGDKSGKASISQAFPGAAGTYTVKFHAVGESDGESIFGLTVGDKSYGTYQVPLSTKMIEEAPTFIRTFTNVVIAAGAKITIDGTLGTDGKEFARARWSKIVFTLNP